MLLVLPRRGAVRGDVGDPGRLQASHRDAGRGGEAGAARGDRRRCREPADPVRRLRRSRARPAHERRDGRATSRCFATWGRSWRARMPRRPPCPGRPTCSTGRSTWRSTICGSCATRSSVSASSSRSRASRPRSSDTTFTLAELRAVYEAVWGVQLDAANFRRSIVAEDGWVIPTGRRARPGPAGGRPAELYRAGRAWSHGGPIHRFQRRRSGRQPA